MLRILQRLVASDGLMRAIAPIAGPFHPWHPDVRRNPYPTWRRLRETAPLVRIRLFGGWATGRYAEAERVLREPCFSTDRSAVPMVAAMRRATRDAPDLRSLFDENLLMIDGARHARLRGLVGKAFTPRRVELLRARTEAIVEELLDQAAARGSMDVVRDLARPLPGIVIGELLGTPARDRDTLLRWSEQLAELLDPLSGRDGIEPPRRATTAAAAYFRTLLAERRASPRDDLLSAMLAAELNGESLSEGELIALCTLILAAGHETTVNLIGSAAVLLLRHPDERKRLQDDLGLLPSAVEECLRFEPPVQLTDRAVVEPCELGGVSLRPGTIVAVVIAAANRDPERFTDPDRFDVSRSGERHLSFGLGSHFCLGAALARLETELALGGLLRRFPDFSGRSDATQWRRSAVLRGPIAVPIELRPQN
jgi:cytochrome P450